MGVRRLFSAVRWVLLGQLLMIALVAVSMLALRGWPEAKSAMLGGSIAFLPNAYFAVQFGHFDNTRTANQIVRSFYLGETIKLILTAILFLFAFQLPGILFMPLFVGFASVLVVFWFALLVRKTEL